MIIPGTTPDRQPTPIDLRMLRRLNKAFPGKAILAVLGVQHPGRRLELRRRGPGAAHPARRTGVPVPGPGGRGRAAAAEVGAMSLSYELIRRDTCEGCSRIQSLTAVADWDRARCRLCGQLWERHVRHLAPGSREVERSWIRVSSHRRPRRWWGRS